MRQSKLGSALEAVASVAIGYAVSVVLTVVVLPLFGYDVSGGDALGISAVFTVTSLLRGYLVRRAFSRFG